MGMWCGWFGMIIAWRFHDSDWSSIISYACHYFRVSTAITPSRMTLNEFWSGWKWLCVAQRGVRCLSVISWSSVEELRCLFVREGENEHFLGLWRQSCSEMLVEDTHRWDWACLNIIHSEWESLSRVMWRGLRNVKLLLPLVLSVVRSGKSSQSILIHVITSHD